MDFSESGVASSSATTLSKTKETNWRTVAPAVFIVVESFVKWRRKHSTKAYIIKKPQLAFEKEINPPLVNFRLI